MKCRTAQRKLGAYLDGELPAEVSARVHQHVQTCPKCAADLAGHWSLGGLLQATPGAEAPRGFAHSVRAEAARRSRGRERKTVLSPWAPVPALARVAATVALLLGVTLGGIMSKSVASVRAVAASTSYEEETDQVSTSLLSALPAGSVAETYLEWIGELE